jgi:hypothetical protein
MYLTDHQTIKLEAELGIDSNLRTWEIADKLREAQHKIDLALCQVAAHWSLEREDLFLETIAIDMVEKFVSKGDSDHDKNERLFRGASIKWALGRYDAAIRELTNTLEFATKLNERKLIDDNKNQLVYFLADWQISRTKEIPQDLIDLAKEYVQALPIDDEDCVDTRGFYLIAFGNADEIMEGWRLVNEAFKGRASHKEFDKFKAFHEYHEYTAIRRLLSAKARL